MGDPFFDLGNFSINHELTDDEDAMLLDGIRGRASGRARLARLTLMRIVSDFREAMWGVLQQGISTLDVDFVAYAGEHFERLLRERGDARVRARPARGRRPTESGASPWARARTLLAHAGTAAEPLATC